MNTVLRAVAIVALLSTVGTGYYNRYTDNHYNQCFGQFRVLYKPTATAVLINPTTDVVIESKRVMSKEAIYLQKEDFIIKGTRETPCEGRTGIKLKLDSDSQSKLFCDMDFLVILTWHLPVPNVRIVMTFGESSTDLLELNVPVYVYTNDVSLRDKGILSPNDPQKWNTVLNVEESTLTVDLKWLAQILRHGVFPSKDLESPQLEGEYQSFVTRPVLASYETIKTWMDRMDM